MVCPECGAENVAGAEWCTRCQYRFTTRSQSEISEIQQLAAVSDAIGVGGTKNESTVEQEDLAELGGSAGRNAASVAPLNETHKPDATVTDITRTEGGGTTSGSPQASNSGTWATGRQPEGIVRRGALFPDVAAANRLDPSWVASADHVAGSDVEYTRIGVTAFRFMLLGALVLFAAAAMPSLVYSVVGSDGQVKTVMRYIPLDIGVSVACGIVALLGRHRIWTILRLSVVGVVLVGVVALRYLTFDSVAVGLEGGVAQSTRLGPSWYLMILGGACLGAAWLWSIRGRLG